MTDKKGSRDISDLKARLGLKKAGGGAAPATGGAVRANGVVPPPGMNLPPPPGVVQAAPSQPVPVIPNAAEDPFGNMNAMAAQATVQRAPEIVIVNDGKPVENVGSQSTGAKVARIAIPAVVALALGMSMGRISKDANVYNDGINGAGLILGNPSSPAQSTVIATKKVIADLDTALDKAQKTGWKPDQKGDETLDGITKKLDFNTTAVFAAKENTMPADVTVEIMKFYAGVAEVKSMLDNHHKLSAGDDQRARVAAAAAKMKDATVKETDSQLLNQAGIVKYGVMIVAPDSAATNSTSSDYGAKLVELGAQYCGDKVTTTGTCDGGGKLEIQQRSEVSGIFNKAEVAASGTDSVPAKKVLILLPGTVRDAFIKGDEPTVSEYAYTARLKDLQKRVKTLLDDANKLQTHLEAEKNKSTRFSFFL